MKHNTLYINKLTTQGWVFLTHPRKPNLLINNTLHNTLFPHPALYPIHLGHICPCFCPSYPAFPSKYPFSSTPRANFVHFSPEVYLISLLENNGIVVIAQRLVAHSTYCRFCLHFHHYDLWRRIFIVCHCLHIGIIQ